MIEFHVTFTKLPNIHAETMVMRGLAFAARMNFHLSQQHCRIVWVIKLGAWIKLNEGDEGETATEFELKVHQSTYLQNFFFSFLY